MFAIGDYVKFSKDGTVGMVIDVKEGRCQVIWEDHFVSWEEEANLHRTDVPTQRNSLLEQAFWPRHMLTDSQ